MDYRLIGTNIRWHRQQLHLSREALAERVDLSGAYVGHLERGTRKPSLETMVKLSEAFAVPLDALVPTLVLTWTEEDTTRETLRCLLQYALVLLKE